MVLNFVSLIEPHLGNKLRVQIKVVADSRRVLQQRPHLFPTSCHETCHCLFPGGEELRFIVPSVCGLHKLISQTLRFSSGGNQALRPALCATATLAGTVVPVEYFPLRPQV